MIFLFQFWLCCWHSFGYFTWRPMITRCTSGSLSKTKIWKDATGIECNTKKKFCVLQKKVLSFGPNPTVEVWPNRTFGWSLPCSYTSEYRMSSSWYAWCTILNGIYCALLPLGAAGGGSKIEFRLIESPLRWGHHPFHHVKTRCIFCVICQS